MLELPGLIDPHVHLREPGGTHKEDFDSGTAAALAGGFTTVLAMPNTEPPITDLESLQLAQSAAGGKARCDYGIFMGAGEGNPELAAQLASQSCGLKIYMDATYGPLRMRSLMALMAHFRKWPSHIACHAEGPSLAVVLMLGHLFERHVHICHISRKEEITLIRMAKERGARVTCEVTPHHLFLSEADVSNLGRGRSEVRPRLAAKEDVAALWDSLDVIDCIATDHAPHTLEEKKSSEPPPGFPGLETSLALIYGGVLAGRLSLEYLIERMHTRPRRIFGLPAQPGTFLEFDPDATWEVRGQELNSRCGWTPFEGMKLRGRVRRVQLRGRLAYETGRVLTPPATGRDLIAEPIFA